MVQSTPPTRNPSKPSSTAILRGPEMVAMCDSCKHEGLCQLVNGGFDQAGRYWPGWLCTRCRLDLESARDDERWSYVDIPHPQTSRKRRAERPRR